MYRIMLADDEGLVLESLTLMIEKNFPGQCCIETAKTGRDVIELAESFRPDIAFMDIKMPGINGMEAIREIQKTNPAVVFIVLSAYDKFDYAREAVRLGVLEYINKPFSAAKITDVLSRAMHDVDQRRQKRSEDLRVREKLETVMPIIENGFISSLIFQEQSGDEVDNYRQLLGMNENCGCMLVLAVGDDQNGSKMTNAVGAGLRTQLDYTRVCELVKETWNCAVGGMIANKLPVFLPYECRTMSYEERIKMIDVCHELTRRFRRLTGLSCRIGIGSVQRIKDSRISYEEALKALDNSTGSVAHVEDLPLRCNYEEEYPIELEKELFDSLKSGRTEECARLAGSFFDWMLDRYGEDNMSVKLKALEFVLWAEHDAYLSGGMTYRFDERGEYLHIVMDAEENSQLKNWFVDKFKTACRNMSTKKGEQENRMVAQAENYIKEHFSRDLSLDEVSRQLNLSPYYFSKLFKEETGSTFVEYLTNLRISRAKELLADENKSVKEICVDVGYSDPNYFSRIFKKTVGMTPTEYKKQAVGETQA